MLSEIVLQVYRTGYYLYLICGFFFKDLNTVITRIYRYILISVCAYVFGLNVCVHDWMQFCVSMYI